MAAVDWSVLDKEGIDDLARRAAGIVVRQYDTFDLDDLHQDARIFIATNPGIVREYLDNGNEGYLSRWLIHRLTDSIRTEARHRTETIGIHRLYEVGE